MLKIIFKDLVTFIVVRIQSSTSTNREEGVQERCSLREYNHIRGERVDGHEKVVIDGSSGNVQVSRISKPASKRIKSSAEAIVFRHIAKTFSRYSWVEYMIGTSFLRRDSLYYCIVMCLVILVQFCKCIILQI